MSSEVCMPLGRICPSSAPSLPDASSPYIHSVPSAHPAKMYAPFAVQHMDVMVAGATNFRRALPGGTWVGGWSDMMAAGGRV